MNTQPFFAEPRPLAHALTLLLGLLFGLLLGLLLPAWAQSAEEDAAAYVNFSQDFVGTGDRSRSDLAAGAEPEPLGCSRSESGPQEWRLVRAVFVD
jgi:hypothetical protein